MKHTTLALGLAALALSALAWLPAQAQDAPAKEPKPAAAKAEGARHRVLVELFTSQG